MTRSSPDISDPFDLCVMIVEEECCLDIPDSELRLVGSAIRDRISCAQRERHASVAQASSTDAALDAIYDALVQAQACIRGETPEDITDQEAREDTINKVRDAMRTIEDGKATMTRSSPETPLDSETIQILLDLLNPLHGSLDEQTYDEVHRAELDLPKDYEHDVIVTRQMERDLTQAVLILENRKRDKQLPRHASVAQASSAKEAFDDTTELIAGHLVLDRLGISRFAVDVEMSIGRRIDLLVREIERLP